ncbi:hypothetical protein Cs308_0772 [Candidatus Chlamydia sanziniae]|uniref:Uncharacterized protein n=1 Tax=Candidatus Chlamydia sanziniae TaxID=1806891 RepID=A0A1A9HXY0_9CHLA|nr:hypothetical protein Cs308_0772 [Candidatus Chlamydia sanziniae]
MCFLGQDSHLILKLSFILIQTSKERIIDGSLFCRVYHLEASFFLL